MNTRISEYSLTSLLNTDKCTLCYGIYLIFPTRKSKCPLHFSDPFVSHFETDLDEKVAQELNGCTNCKKEQVKVGGSVN